MRFLIAASLSLLVGLALGSPIGEVEVTTLRTDLLRSDLDFAASDATTVVVEVFADDATAVVSATERARQAPAGGAEEESNEDNEEEEPTTASSTGGSSGKPSAGGRRPPPSIPQPLANSSDFLAEYQFSSQFNLGPKDESVPLVVAPGQAQPVEQIPQIGEPVAAAAQPIAQVAQGVPPNLPPAVPAPVVAANPSDAAVPAPLSAGNAQAQVPAVPASVPSITAAGEDEDDAESEEDAPTEAPTARLQQQQQQQVEAQRIEESDSDNEITNDDVTTVKSFASEYEYTVQQLAGGPKRRGETKDGNFLTEKLTSSLPSTLLVPIISLKTEQINSNKAHSFGRNDTGFLLPRVSGVDGLDIESPGGGALSDGEGRAACECGKLPFRVPIGSEAEINLRPWTVAIVRGGLIAGGRPHCAGVLINDRYVLSSASCLDGLHPNGLQVWLTAHNTLYNHHLNVGTSKLNVQEVIVHPNFNRNNRDNDIALIKMTQPVDISTSSSYFTPVCLPSGSSANYAGRYGMIFGWGYGRVNRICTGEVPILENSVCKRDTQHGTGITENMMCAGFLTPSAPVRTEDCLGDAGGPLTVQLNGRMSLIGITSWGFEFHHRGHNPTVFTKVAGYADWILHNTEDADWCVG